MSRLMTFPVPFLRIIAVVAAVSAPMRSSGQPAPLLPVPLVRAHAHNDYQHARPLLDALDHGFCSVEADVHLVDGRLLVAHDRIRAKRDRTLEALYLGPLRERVRTNHGRVYRDGSTVTLLIDFKSDAEATYAVLQKTLEEYADVLTVFSDERIETKAVSVIISGNRPRTVMAAEKRRLCALDGRISDLDASAPVHLIPLVSDSWRNRFQWRGGDPMPETEQQRLRQLVERIHERGCRARFWAAPDTPAAWRELLAAGVDLINTDDLAGLQQFLLATEAGKDE